MIINTAADLQGSPASPEKTAFLTSLLNDYVVFDDAEYPEDYNRFLTSEDEGYIEPIIRKVWNAGAAAAWGFTSREDIVEILDV